MRHNPIRRLPTHHEPASAPALPTLPWMAAEVVVVRRPVRDRVLDARCDSVDPFGGLLDGLDRRLLRPGGEVGDRHRSRSRGLRDSCLPCLAEPLENVARHRYGAASGRVGYPLTTSRLSPDDPPMTADPSLNALQLGAAGGRRCPAPCGAILRCVRR